MKSLAKIVGVLLLVVVAVPIVRYRTVDPCRALEREIVTRVEREMRTARDSVRAAAGEVAGDSAARSADRIASAVENFAAGVAAGAAKTKVENMTRRECVAELWRMAVRDE